MSRLALSDLFEYPCYGTTDIIDAKYNTLVHCCFNAGPASATLPSIKATMDQCIVFVGTSPGLPD